MLTVKDDKGKNLYPLLEPDSYPAVCCMVADIGEQFSEMFGKSSRKVLFVWELSTALIDIGGEMVPRTISETYTMSLNEKATLRQRLEGWRGRVFTPDELEGFDLGKVLGQPCLLNIIQAQKKDGTPYSKINGVSRLPKGMNAPKAAGPLILFDLDAPDALNQMNQLPEWVQGRIKASETYKALLNPPPEAAHLDIDVDEDGDIPF